MLFFLLLLTALLLKEDFHRETTVFSGSGFTVRRQLSLRELAPRVPADARTGFHFGVVFTELVENKKKSE